MKSIEERMAVLLNEPRLEAKKKGAFKPGTFKIGTYAGDIDGSGYDARGKHGDLADIVARDQAKRPKDFAPQRKMAQAKLDAPAPDLKPKGGFSKWVSKAKKLVGL